jgi:hypothetical protein
MQLQNVMGAQACRRAVILAAALVTLAPTAPANVPGQINYQGLLLDASGDPITGMLDLSFSLFETDSGGIAIWTEAHDAVDVLDGVYEVSLGSVVSLTPALLSGATTYLEVEVEGETLTPRQRLLAVPYAIQAEAANTLGEFNAQMATQVFQNFAFDGGEPPNDDPREGSADVDLDGVSNFLDNDNDGDGVSDTAELAQGTDINLITPVLDSATPATGHHCLVTNVVVQGSNFDPGVAVGFGSQSPTPISVTPTSFSVAVGPQAIGPASVSVTNLNGEQDTEALFDFVEITPTITSFDPPDARSTTTTTVTVHGTQFEPGLTVAFGSETPTPTNLTPTRFDVVVGPQPVTLASVTVTNPCGEQAQSSFNFTHNRAVFVSSVTYSSDLGGLAGADAKCNALAAAAGLGGTYLAWLSDGVDSPDTRFAKIGPYVTVLSDVIAVDWDDLTDGDIGTQIRYSEIGSSISDQVFTNVATDGTTQDATDHCQGWTSADSGDSGNYGNTVSTQFGWTNSGTIACGSMERIYCFEQ